MITANKLIFLNSLKFNEYHIIKIQKSLTKNIDLSIIH